MNEMITGRINYPQYYIAYVQCKVKCVSASYIQLSFVYTPWHVFMLLFRWFCIGRARVVRNVVKPALLWQRR